MKLPKREFYTVHEVAARWGYTIADVAGWSAAGHFDILTGIPPAICGEKVVAGEVIISAFDILPMFRRCGTVPQTAWLRRVRTKGETDWQLITDPIAGVEVSLADLLIAGQHVHRFEEKNVLFRRVSGGTGSVSPYDWEGSRCTATFSSRDTASRLSPRSRRWTIASLRFAENRFEPPAAAPPPPALWARGVGAAASVAPVISVVFSVMFYSRSCRK